MQNRLPVQPLDRARAILVRVGLACLFAVAALFAPTGDAAVQGPPFAFEFAGLAPAPAGLREFAGDVTVDSEGNVWVVDSAVNRIVKYDYNGSFIAAFTRAQGAPAPFARVLGLGADSRRGVYVVDRGIRVIKMDLGGRLERVYGNTPPPPGATRPVPLSGASDVDVSAEGVIHVLEVGRIARYRQDGTALPDIDLPAGVPGGSALALAGNGEIYVNALTRIVRLSAAGARLSDTVLTSGGGIAVVTLPGNVVRVYANDGMAGIVREYSRSLAFVGNLTSRGTGGAGPGQTLIPSGIDVDCRKSVYVVEGAVTPAGAASASKVMKFADPAAAPPPCTPPPPLTGVVDTQVNDIDVTQAVQWERDRTATDAPAGPRTRAFSADTEIEVPLRAGGRTVVRVYASLRSGPAGGLGNVPATLEGMRSGRSLGVITPDGGPAVLRVGDARVEPAERRDPAGAYTFTLPDEWTQFGRLDLIARVNPAGIGCDTACRQRSTFRLTRVPFRLTTASCSVARVACTDNPYGVDVWPIALTNNGALPSDAAGVLQEPGRAFDAAQAVTPVRLKTWGWMGQIEIGDLARATIYREERCLLGIDLGILCTDEEERLQPGSARAREVLQGMLMDRIQELKEDRQVGSATVLIGLIGAVRPELPGAMRGKFGEERLAGLSVTETGARGYADVTRPITAVAHELQHALGRGHAGRAPACYTDPNQVGEPWRDFGDRGLLFGVGLDTRPRSGAGRGPYRVVAPGMAGLPNPLYDLMSYCGSEGDSWVSTIGWNQIIGYRPPPGAVPALLRTGAERAAADVSLIRVTAVERAGGSLAVTGTSPMRGAAAPPDPAARYQVEARDVAGRILASAPMASNVLAEGPTLLTGAVPAPEAMTQVVVRRGTEAAARRQRSASPPSVRLLQPRAGARVTGRMTVVWSASDPDGDRLSAAVELSTNGGRSYRILQVGPSAGRVAIPQRLLADSRNARVRVRVDDGFREASATSGRLTVVGPAPAVRIVSPAPGQRIRADAPLRLAGEATGAGGRPFGRRAFQWRDGQRNLGRGTPITVAGLRPGRHVFRLGVRQGGRVGRASVTVIVVAVRPAFLRLDRPQRVSPGARAVRLRVATTIAANLVVGRRRYPVGPRPRNVTVAVRPGTAPLRLTLLLRSGRLETGETLVIERKRG